MTSSAGWFSAWTWNGGQKVDPNRKGDVPSVTSSILSPAVISNQTYRPPVVSVQPTTPDSSWLGSLASSFGSGIAGGLQQHQGAIIRLGQQILTGILSGTNPSLEKAISAINSITTSPTPPILDKSQIDELSIHTTTILDEIEKMAGAKATYPLEGRDRTTSELKALLPVVLTWNTLIDNKYSPSVNLWALAQPFFKLLFDTASQLYSARKSNSLTGQVSTITTAAVSKATGLITPITAVQQQSAAKMPTREELAKTCALLEKLVHSEGRENGIEPFTPNDKTSLQTSIAAILAALPKSLGNLVTLTKNLEASLKSNDPVDIGFISSMYTLYAEFHNAIVQTTPPEDETTRLGTFLAVFKSTIADLLGKQFVGAAILLLQLLKRGLESAKRSMETSDDGNVQPKYEAGHRWVTNLIALIDAAKDKEGLERVKVELNSEHEVVHIAGIPLPWTGGPETQLSESHSFHAQMEALKEPQRFKNGDVEPDFDSEIEHERGRFSQNSTRFTCFKIVENSFGLPVNDALYYKWMKEAGNNENANSILENKFFAQIDASNVSWWAKQGAKALYYVLKGKGFVKGYMEEFVEQATKASVARADQFIINNENDKFFSFGSSLIANIQNYFAFLKGTFAVVSEKQVAAALHPEMGLALARGVEDGGKLSRNALYQQIAETALEQFDPKLIECELWASKITELFGTVVKWSLQWIPNFSSGYDQTVGRFLNMISKIYYFFVYYTLGITLFRLVNWGFKKALLRIVDAPRTINALLSKSVQALANNGYTHALNKIAIVQAGNIWLKLQEQASGPGAPQPSGAQKRQFEALVKEMLPIAELSKLDNQQEVRNYLEGNGLKWLKESLVAKTVENALGLCAIAWEATFKGDILKAHLLQTMRTINASFQEGKPVTPEDYAATESELTLVRERILRFSIDGALKKALEFSMEDQEVLAKQQIGKLKETAANLQKQGTVIEELRKDSQNSQKFAGVYNTFYTFLRTNLSIEFDIRGGGGAHLVPASIGQLLVQVEALKKISGKATDACIAIKNIHDRDSLRNTIGKLLDALAQENKTIIDAFNAAQPHERNPMAVCEATLGRIKDNIRALEHRNLFVAGPHFLSSEIDATFTAVQEAYAKRNLHDANDRINGVFKQIHNTLSQIYNINLQPRNDDETTIETNLNDLQKCLEGIQEWSDNLTFKAPINVPFNNAALRYQLFKLVRNQVHSLVGGMGQFFSQGYNLQGLLDTVILDPIVKNLK